jgi:hypothetical protein
MSDYITPGMPHGVRFPSRGTGTTVSTNVLFDPADYSVADVLQHLEDYPEDADRVLRAEAGGKNRKGIIGEANYEPSDPAVGDHLDNATE